MENPQVTYALRSDRCLVREKTLCLLITRSGEEMLGENGILGNIERV